MLLLEFDKEELKTGYYDPSEDKISARHPTDTRKGNIPLKAINRLKKQRAYKKLEALKREDLMGVMYAKPDEGGGGGPMGF